MEDKLAKVLKVVKGMKENRKEFVARKPSSETVKRAINEITILATMESILTSDNELNEWLKLIWVIYERTRNIKTSSWKFMPRIAV